MEGSKEWTESVVCKVNVDAVTDRVMSLIKRAQNIFSFRSTDLGFILKVKLFLLFRGWCSRSSCELLVTCSGVQDRPDGSLSPWNRESRLVSAGEQTTECFPCGGCVRIYNWLRVECKSCSTSACFCSRGLIIIFIVAPEHADGKCTAEPVPPQCRWFVCGLLARLQLLLHFHIIYLCARRRQWPLAYRSTFNYSGTC